MTLNGFFISVIPRGHKIYLKSGPNYDFIQFRSLVKDITQDFKRISEEIINIECQLRALNPDFSVHIATVQDYEKQHLALVSLYLVTLYILLINLFIITQMARQQLLQQELQDHLHDGSETDILKQEIVHLHKELSHVQEMINENLQAICYQIADIV